VGGILGKENKTLDVRKTFLSVCGFSGITDIDHLIIIY